MLVRRREWAMLAVDVAREGAKFSSQPKVIYNVGSFFSISHNNRGHDRD